ncbi:MAG TPA: uracil phosphoribosyltransferase [Herpetosiphon sp.]|uniref:Uracil phosphoribosyltransferase n=1 Tax=Herpetosiphon aurantiacus (strain ATCC 23779 / DSM 785 / 114-95) TaxID=316274 RepID=A9AUA9_HERA2|nr:uracil phosphoribosyltransferase [Herpetosiphon sp.]ABX03028.1 uracil phosphoribosyltransferase [Herpetosiphon aurantiacus DSM 785]MCA0352378.1 uracil phosphoribosyltransferase [Chloroflexota bacterium]HBW50869.1 uracil phosphoribosyltransferase [Herpetosiphon sp.]
MGLHVSSHPLVLHKLALLRRVESEPKKFRELVREISQFLVYEATADMPLAPYTIQTPLSTMQGHAIGARIGLIPILRAGLGMVEPVIDLLPTAHVWHLGLYRDHNTLEPVTYYNKLPAQPDIDVCLILDPMLATGGSAVAAVDILKAWGAAKIKFLGLIAAPEGVERLQTAHPDVEIHLAALDERLNEQGYIVPGLGDAGDRQFGT